MLHTPTHLQLTCRRHTHGASKSVGADEVSLEALARAQASGGTHSTCANWESQKTTNALSRADRPSICHREAQATCEYELVVLL